MRREREGKDRTLIRSVTLSLRFLYFTSTIFLSHPISIFFKTEKNCEVKCFLRVKMKTLMLKLSHKRELTRTQHTISIKIFESEASLV